MDHKFTWFEDLRVGETFRIVAFNRDVTEQTYIKTNDAYDRYNAQRQYDSKNVAFGSATPCRRV